VHAPNCAPATLRRVSSDSEEPTWATTEQVMAAAGVGKASVFRWAKLGVMPAFETVYVRGRYARWPLHAPAQAAWVDGKLRAGWTFEEIRKALERGEFSLAKTGK